MYSLLKGQPEIGAANRAALLRDYERFQSGLPDSLEAYVRDHYQIDLSSEYGNQFIKNPFGKGSGQLFLNTSQVRRDCEEGLGFVVLKSIIAEDASGGQSMSEWAIEETRMVVERITGSDHTQGWTVSWKGRGWYDTFAKYLEFFDKALSVARPASVLVVPSCKYHLPSAVESLWKI